MLKGKRLLEYTNLFSKICSIIKKMKKFYSVICSKLEIWKTDVIIPFTKKTSSFYYLQ